MAQQTQKTPPMQVNTIVHTEIASNDVRATRKFLDKTFQWRFEDMPGKDPYTMMHGPGGSFGGLRQVAEGEPGPSVTSYILVDDIQAAARRVEKNGGKIIVPIREIPGMGSMFWFEVPGGFHLACWQEAPGEPSNR